MSDSPAPRSPRPRPRLAHWVWERGYTWNEAGELFECSGEAVRLWCLPFDDPGRRTPDKASLGRIVRVTGGVIGGADFIPPHLNGASAPHAADRVPEDVQ